MELSSEKPTRKPTPAPVRTKRPTRMPSGKPTPNSSEQVQQGPPSSSSFLTPPVSDPQGPPSSSSFLTPPASDPAAQESVVSEPVLPVQSDSIAEEVPNSLPSLKPVLNLEYREADVMQSNIIVRLRNIPGVMNESQQNKYSEVLLEYLRSHPSLLDASINVLNVTIWHQEAVIPKKKKIKKVQEKSQSKPKRGPKARKRLLRAIRALQKESVEQSRKAIAYSDVLIIYAAMAIGHWLQLGL